VFSGGNVEGREDATKQSLQHVEKLASSVCGWRLGHPAPSAGEATTHDATTSPSAWPKPGVLTHVDFAGGGYVKFGSIAWESAFYKCSADGY